MAEARLWLGEKTVMELDPVTGGWKLVVDIDQMPDISVSLTGTTVSVSFPATLGITGSVGIQNVPLPVTFTGFIPITGSVAISNSYLPVSGSVAINNDPFLIYGGGNSPSVTLTVTSGTYSINDVVGGLITLPNAVTVNGKHSLIPSLELVGMAAIAYELWLFNADIATPAADNAAMTLATADLTKILGVIPIGAGDYVNNGTYYVATVRQISKLVQAGAATSTIYAYLKATATTSPATTKLYLTVDFVYVD